MSQRQGGDRPFFGIMLMMGFVVFGPFIDIFAKLATETVPVIQIATFRFVVQGVLLFPIAILIGCLTWPSRRDMGLYVLRGFLIFMSTATIVGAVKFMPIADAIAIVFIEPLILLLLGSVFLGEAVGWRRLVACVVGFVGAILVIRPSFAAFGWPAFLPLATAVFFAIYLILTRTMSQRLHPLAMQSYTSIGALVVSVPVLLWFNGSGIAVLDPVMPQGNAVWWIICCGTAAAVSHMFLSYAFRFAPTTLLGSIHYFEIVTATIYGYLIFGDLFDGIAAIGVGIIIGSGLYLMYRERQLSRQAP